MLLWIFGLWVYIEINIIMRSQHISKTWRNKIPWRKFFCICKKKVSTEKKKKKKIGSGFWREVSVFVVFTKNMV